ncbi:MAG TPA: 4-hydroxy-tetrahydrodipicolinate reductase, partial [Methyloradius sp.]
MLKVVIAGCSGRMGHALLEGVFADKSLTLHGALDRADSIQIGRDAGEKFGKTTGVKISHDVHAALHGADVLVDFTRPEASLDYIAACRQAKVKLVIGTTGFSPEQKQIIESAAQDIAIVFAPNMSVGVTLLINLVQAAAKVLADGYDIEIIEAHHRHKIDAPSGTALRLG